MASQSSELDALKDIPGYKAILKSVLKSQIQLLIEQLSDQTGEESIILTASVNDGTLSHLGSSTGKGFLEGRDEIKSQFLGYCLKTHHRKKTQETRSPYQRSNVGVPRAGPQHAFTKRPRVHTIPPQRQEPLPSYRSLSDSSVPRQDSDSNLPAGVDTSDTGQNQSFHSVIKQEQTESGGENQDSYNPSDPVSFPDSLQRSHTQTSADQSNTEADRTVDRGADESNDSASASIKIEPITENEMELEITGVEPGNTSVSGDNWGQGQGAYSSTGGDPLSQGADQSDYSQEKWSAFGRRRSADSAVAAGAHTLRRSEPDEGEVQKTPKPRAKTVACLICGKFWQTSAHLRRHMRTHTGERPFRCDVCGRDFTQRVHMESHRLLHYNKEIDILKNEAANDKE